jgi:transposase
MARQPDPRKQQRWFDLMQRWRQSQLTVRAFCDRHGLNEANFYLWRRVLRERGLLDDPSTPAQRVPHTQHHAAFVELTVDPPSATAIEVVLRDQRLLRVHPGFDPATLRQLLGVLEEPAC